MAQEAAGGLRILRDTDDKDHPEHLYAEKHFSEYLLDATGLTFVLADTSPVDVDETAGTGGGADLGQNNGCTQGAVTTCEITVNAAGTYRGHINCQVTGENTEVVTLRMLKNAAAFSPVATVSTTPLTADLIDQVHMERLFTALKGDVIKFQVSASAAGTVVLTTGSFGIEQIKSANYLE
jgi:hypothetical protein